LKRVAIREGLQAIPFNQQQRQQLVNLSDSQDDTLFDARLSVMDANSKSIETIGKEEIAKRAAEEKRRQPFTLTPGQTRFDAEGNVIAQVRPKEPTPETRTSLAKNLELAGIDPQSVEGRQIIKDAITKPGVKIDLNKGLDFKIPAGTRLVDRNDPTKGVEPIPGGPKDTLSGENAAKAQMLRTAIKASKGIRGLVCAKDGSLDRVNLFNANFATPGTKGRELRNKMEFGIQAITRGETGAAMPDSEVDNTRERFQPSLFDSVKTANLKLKMFDEFLRGNLKLIDPTGRFNTERFNDELTARGGEVTTPEVTTPQDTGKTTALEDVNKLKQQRQKNIRVDF